LTNAKITFKQGAYTYIYDSGVISEPINDNSCNYSIASTYTQPLTIVNADFVYDTTLYVIDTLYQTIENCEIIGGYPIDSASIFSYEILDSSTVQISWVIWQHGVPSLIGSQYNYFEEGVYAIYITIQCESNTKTFYSYFINGVIDINYGQISIFATLNIKNKILIYPNPANDEVFIELPTEEKIYSNYKVFSIDGKKILEGKLSSSKTKISTQNIEKGVYFFEVNGIVEKIIITK
jgi:hypothetical protein